MPRKPPDLIIELAAPPLWTYAPGGKIIGTIVRKDPIVAPEATLTLVLIGVVKTSGGEGIVKHQGECEEKRQLLAPDKQVLFKGPLHLAQANIESQNECLSWRFDVPIPTKPWVSPYATPSEPRYKTLPGSFYSRQSSGNSARIASVAYHLEARLSYHRGGALVQSVATAPIKMRHPTPQDALSSHDLKPKFALRTVEGYRLLPGMTHSALTFRQWTQQCLGSSKVPRCRFTLTLQIPTVIQLNDPRPIPLRLGVTLESESTSESLRDVSRVVRLNWVRMVLSCSTHLKVRGKHCGINATHYDLRLEDVFQSLEEPVVMTTAGSGCVDIGGMFRLGVRADGFTAADKRLSYMKIEPDFVTYNLIHTHYVDYEISVTVDGEVRTAKFLRERLRIMGCMDPSAVDDC